MISVRITSARTAEILGVKPATVVNWRLLQIGPPFARDGRKIIYLLSDVLEYKRTANLRTSTKEEP